MVNEINRSRSAQPHDKRSAVTSLAGQDVIIGSCTLVSSCHGSKQNQIRIQSSIQTRFIIQFSRLLEERKDKPTTFRSWILNFFARTCNLYAMENNLYIGKKQKKLFLSTEKEDIIKIETRIVSGSFLRWPAIELIKRLDDTRGEILFHRVFFRRKDLYRSRRRERKRETVLVISFSLVVAGLRVYRIHGFDHSLANLPWTWRRRGGGRLGNMKE